jgi:hypothetical protein
MRRLREMRAQFTAFDDGIGRMSGVRNLFRVQKTRELSITDFGGVKQTACWGCARVQCAGTIVVVLPLVGLFNK